MALSESVYTDGTPTHPSRKNKSAARVGHPVSIILKMLLIGN